MPKGKAVIVVLIATLVVEAMANAARFSSFQEALDRAAGKYGARRNFVVKPFHQLLLYPKLRPQIKVSFPQTK